MFSLHSLNGTARSRINLPAQFYRVIWLAVILTFYLTAQVTAADQHNFARNSDFERCFTGYGAADSWLVTRSAQSGVNARDDRAGVGGGACHRLMVPDNAPVDTYTCISFVHGLLPGDRGFFSYYVRTDGVHDGKGAYANLSYYNADGNLISHTDTPRSLTGTTGWERISQPFAVPHGTARIDINIMLHGHGTAFFDRIQVEKSNKLTPWSSAEASISGKASTSQIIAIFKDDVPPSGTASDPTHLRSMAKAAGYEAEFVNANDLADRSKLIATGYSVLVMPYGGSFPANAAEGIKSFLESGGSLLNTGGYPFDHPLARTSQGWIDPADVEPAKDSLRLLIDPAVTSTGWRIIGRDHPERDASVTVDTNRKSLTFGTQSIAYGEWLILMSPPVQGLPSDSRTLVFRARSIQPDIPMAVEVVERDGARWWAPVILSTKWRIYQVDLGSLRYWPANPSVGRGGPGDGPHPADVVGVRFSFTTEFCTEGKAYQAKVVEVWTSPNPLEASTYKSMNSATGVIIPATFMIPDPAAISICDAGSPLSDAVRITASSGVRDLPSGTSAPDGICGWSATAQTSYGGPGIAIKARWSPMADALDRYGRKRGTAFAIMWNYGGAYPGSAWAYSGISNLDIFKPGNKFGESLFKSTLARLTRGVFVYEAHALSTCVRNGEPVRVSARIGSMSRSAVKGTVSLTVQSSGKTITRITQTAEIPAHGSAPVTFSFNPPTDANGLLKLRLSVDVPGSPSDGMDCGVVVWNPERQTLGPKLAYKDCYLDKGNGPEFMLGSQIYWGGDPDPLRWTEKLSHMADNGISIARCFMNVPAAESEEGWRQRDATIEKDIKVGHTVAERYRAAPGLFVDIQNEPIMPVTAEGPDAQRIMSRKMRDWAARVREGIVSTDPKRLVSVGYLNGSGLGDLAWDPIGGSRDLDFTNRHYYGPLWSYAVEFKQIDMRLLGKAPSTGEFGCTSHPGLKAHLIYEPETDAVVRYGYIPHICFGLGGIFCSNWHWQDPIEDIFPCGQVLADGTVRDRLQSYRNSGALFRTIHPRYQSPSLWFVIPDSRLGPDKIAIEAAMNRGLLALTGLHVEFGVVQEEDLSKLPPECKAVIWPIPGKQDLKDKYAILRIPENVQSPAELRSLITDFFSNAGISRHALTPDLPELQSFRVPGEAGSVAHVLWNTTDKPLHAVLSDLPKPVTIDLAPHAGGFAAFDGKGRLIAAEGKSIAVDGKVVMTGDATIGAISLDGLDLLQSRGVLLLPLHPGKIRFTGMTAKSVVSVGEVSGAKWVEYKRVKPQNNNIKLDRSMARSWLIMGTPDQITNLAGHVLSSTLPPGASLQKKK